MIKTLRTVRGVILPLIGFASFLVIANYVLG